MKNKEKFAKEILDIVCNGDEVAMDKDRMMMQACGGTECENCYFSPFNYPHNTGDCEKNFVHWANSEYKEKKEFSEADKALVKGLDKLNWFARNKDGEVYGYVDKPFKGAFIWDVRETSRYEIRVEKVSGFTSATFEPLSWEDEEPTSREEILGDENEHYNIWMR